MSTHVLPVVPSISHLKYQAKDLLRALKKNDAAARIRVQEYFPNHGTVALSDALLIVAREYGFSSWTKLKRHVEELAGVESQAAKIRAAFAAGNTEVKTRILSPAHAKERFENYDPHAATLTHADARLLIANKEGYATWRKYESVLHLDPGVRDVIAAVRAGDLKKVKEILATEAAAANPHWVAGFPTPDPIYNDSIPLFCVSEAVFRGTIKKGNEYDIASALIAAGADPDISASEPLCGAGSFGALNVVKALLDGGAAVDGVGGDGAPMSYPMLLGFTAITELIAASGAKVDLRFAAGLGLLKKVKSYFRADGSLKADAGTLADAHSPMINGHRAFLAERTRETILGQALLFACLHNRIEVARYLLQRGVDVNAIVRGIDTKCTVLHRLCCGGNEQTGLPVVKFLLEHGARTDIKDEEYHSTPVGWAIHNKQYQTRDLLMEWDKRNA